MALAIGHRLGPYEITGVLGAGGMGEVYRARDLKLARDVALKVLPDEFAADADRLARFEREAQLLASLNHQHIAAIYGIEDSTDVRGLVLELVDGETLGEKLALASGPAAPGLPIDEAIAIAAQIAEALEAAHNQGIIHRDLKPSNIKVKPDGTVKVLDFGLAKLNAPSVATATGSTITAPPMRTEVGMILGTAAYMAPEQARGQTADKRSDIWAFGCILHEMLTGRRFFDGEHASDTMPLAIRTLLRRCLERDPRNRIADAATARFVLEEASSLSVGERQAPGEDRVIAARRAQWAVAVGLAAPVVIVGAVLAGTYVWMRARPIAARVVRTSIALTDATAITVSAQRELYSPTPDLAMTPDGSRIVYVGSNGAQILVRALDSLEPVVIARGSQLRNPFVSPDGQWVGYAESRFVLKKVPINGGPPVPLPARLDTDLAGATWLPDDTIVFSTFGQILGLRRTTAAPGPPSSDPEVLTRPNQAQREARHVWPEALPGGEQILFTITSQTGGPDAAQVAVFDRRTHTQKILIRGGSSARYVRDAAGAGHLVYAAGGALRAIGFDLDTLDTRGTAVPLAPQLLTMLNGGADFAVASDGTLAYVRADEAVAAPTAPTTLASMDRTGREQAVNVPARRYGWVRVSPDGTRLVLGTGDGGAAIWVWDMRRSTLTAIRLPPGGQGNGPIWTSDGRRIVFQGTIPGEPANIWWAPADGSGVAERLTTTKTNPQRPTGVSPDGSQLLFMEAAPSLDVLRLALDRSRTVTPLFSTPAWEAGAVLSPNGRWLAYESDASGRLEVNVSPYPGTSASQLQVSMLGGNAPRWSHDGRELFFVDPSGALMQVAVQSSEGVWQSGTPAKAGQLLDSLGGSWYGAYDVAPDGRVVLIKNPAINASAAQPQIVVVQHFDEELTAERVN